MFNDDVVSMRAEGLNCLDDDPTPMLAEGACGYTMTDSDIARAAQNARHIQGGFIPPGSKTPLWANPNEAAQIQEIFDKLTKASQDPLKYRYIVSRKDTVIYTSNIVSSHAMAVSGANAYIINNIGVSQEALHNITVEVLQVLTTNKVKINVSLC
jgi:hypothetical protein